MREKIAVGLSGGVDSGVAAYLLKKKGWDVTGVTLKFHSKTASYYDPEGLYLARQICQKLGIDHCTINVEDLFKKEVIDYFINSYLEGLTPNPCAYCNRLIKFGILLEKIKSLGISYLATGHYVRIAKKKNIYFLRKNKDARKSQEYFLSLIKPSVLRHIIFPLGGYTKKRVKKIAKDKKILFKGKKESQDVCFIKDKYYPEFIEENISDYYKHAGDIKYIKGDVLGRHNGIYYYTYGQREGIGISWQKPLYVAAIDSKTNTLIVGEKEFLYKDSFSVHSLNWFLVPEKCPPASKLRKTNGWLKDLKVKVRYNSASYDCSLKITEDKGTVALLEKVDIIAPGQIAAFYYKDLLLGGGIISKTN